MPTVKNLNYGPLSIARADKDPLTLGPRETADISERELASEEVQRHLRDKRIALLPGRGNAEVRTRGQRPEGRGGSAPSTPTSNE